VSCPRTVEDGLDVVATADQLRSIIDRGWSASMAEEMVVALIVERRPPTGVQSVRLSSHRSASMAAIHPEAAAVTACR
jgi:hypothetical protein